MNEATNAGETNVTNFPTTDESSEPGRESLLMQPNEELLDALRQAHEEVKEKKEKRAEINLEVSAIYKRLEGLGIDKKAAKAVFAMYELEEEQRRMYDLSASVCRKALAMPLQGDLFHAAQLDATAAGHQAQH